MEQKFLKKISEIQPPKELKEAVLMSIKMAQQKQIRRRKIMFFAGFIFSAAAAIFSGAVFGKEILTSEFWSIASLSISDAQVVLRSWQEYGLSLLETFPTAAFASLLAPLCMILILVKKYVQEADNVKFNFKF